ncbi:MAG TPA: glycosyltransferase family 4 protein [Candidatus Sulfotelmatobacter sp.]|nr:glycosyltransferase family 4 protein [Candidatus Sulfotelmatobacter sp.]
MEILMAAGVPRRREGGVAAIMYNLGRELTGLGHRVDYVFYEDLMTPAEMAGRFRDLRFALRLARLLRKDRKKYSVVNLHAPIGFAYGMLRRMLAGGEYPPYVMTLHGLEERRLHVMRREVKKGRAWHFSLGNRLWHRVYHAPRFFLSIKTADFAHCYSRDVWTLLQLKYDLDSGQVAYVPNGVEERFFLRREYDGHKPVRMLFAGTWLDQRGIFYLRDALEALNKKFPDWTLTIAGAGVEPERLKAFFGDALRDRILVSPVVPADRMPELYAEHDIFVFPSLMEGLPGVLLEAMATGMPAVTAETCGMVDVVQDDVNGLLIPPADGPALESALLRLCTDANLRQRLGAAAQERMRHLTWRAAAGKLERVFARALQNGHGNGE